MLNLDRRLLLKTATFGVAALSLPGVASAFQAMRGFTHGVASGEPGPDSVLLWTRFVADNDTPLTAEIALSPDFAKPKAGATTLASGDRDHIAKAVVTGLEPGRWYFYRFVAADGTTSPIGRTRTLPVGPTAKFSMGVYSCSNMPFGWFNAYAHGAARTDLDLVMHLGDYFYEYGAGTYPAPDQAVAGRIVSPPNEIVTLADYRLRYASYRADPDLQRLHQVFPMLAMWDDHEFANDSWEGGAQNHQPDIEGNWTDRKRIAERVYREWMPVSDRPTGADRWSRYDIGDLATLIFTESRITARDKQPELAEVLAGQADIEAALKRFRDGAWQDPDRHMLGVPQSEWFGQTLANSRRQGKRWQVWAQQCVMGSLSLPPETANWIPQDAPDYVRQRATIGLLAAKVGLPYNFDSWDGYPAARERLLRAAQQADANLVVLSGDSHNGWAFDLEADQRPAGVEFAGHSVTSPGFEGFAPTVAPDDLAAAMMRANPDLKWADTGSRGYMTVTLEPDRASAQWHKLNTIRSRDPSLSGSIGQSVALGTNRLT